MEAAPMVLDQHEKDKNKARIAAALFALVLLFFTFYPFWSYPFPPPGQSGILVTFGETSGGDSENDIQQNQEVIDPGTGEQTETSAEATQPSTPAHKSIQSKSSVQSRTTSTLESEVPSGSTENQKTAQEQNKQLTPEEIRQNKEAEEARKKNEFEQAKKQFGDLLTKGAGDPANPQKTGDPKGDPSVDALEGISKGTGNVGGGLSDRGVIFEPEITENSQKAGIVVVRVCVNNRGEVIEAVYTQLGSTTTDSDLTRVAIEGARRYKFSRSPIERQCGTITIEFKLK